MVRSDLKRIGIGGALMKKIIQYCRDRGIKEIVGQMLADNRAMEHLTQKLGFEIEPVPNTDRVELRLKL